VHLKLHNSGLTAIPPGHYPMLEKLELTDNNIQTYPKKK